MRAIILLCMVFCHIVDDYYLQGILASMKQRNWWKTNAPDDMYKHDYIVALIMHSFSWAFMIMLPIGVYLFANGMLMQNNIIMYICWILGNSVIHAVIDHLKANKKVINLVQDQSYHMIQIFLVWLTMLFV